MQKTYILIRHAKSSWSEPGLSDFDRPLNDRGRRDAPIMAQHLISKMPEIDLLISSQAKRAKLTAQYFIKEWNLEKEQVFYTKDLYHATPSEIRTLIRSIDDNIESIAMVGHNPGLTECINRVPQVSLDNLPTCGIYTGKYEGRWRDFEFDVSAHHSIVFPKMLNNA